VLRRAAEPADATSAQEDRGVVHAADETTQAAQDSEQRGDDRQPCLQAGEHEPTLDLDALAVPLKLVVAVDAETAEVVEADLAETLQPTVWPIATHPARLSPSSRAKRA